MENKPVTIDTEFFVKLSAKLIEDNFASIADKVLSLGKKGYEGVMQSTGLAFKKYLQTIVTKYSEVKTILYRDKPVFLYDFFIELDLQYQKDCIATKNINNVLELRNSIIITGLAGSGKSILLKHLFLNSIKNTKLIPIYIELRDLNSYDGKFVDFLLENLASFNLELEKESFLKLLGTGKFIFFLDGFDEIKIDLIEKTQKEILKLRDKYTENKFIITFRPDNTFISWINFLELRVMPLDLDKALNLISNLDYDIDIKKQFYNEVKEHLYSSHESFMSNPLLLTIMLMTFSYNAEIPSKMHLFYYQAFETLFNKHDATKAGYKRETYAKLSIDDFMKVLSSFSINSYIDGQLNFSSEEINAYMKNAIKLSGLDFEPSNYLNDLLKSVCIIIQDGLMYTFTHRTFQEYFVAIFISNTNVEKQKKLIKRIQDRIAKDSTFKLLFEINREMLERVFILPMITELKKKFNYDDRDDSFILKYLEFTFSRAIINDDGRTSFFINNSKYIDFINFIYHHYQHIYAVSKDHYIGTEKVKNYREDLIKTLHELESQKVGWMEKIVRGKSNTTRDLKEFTIVIDTSNKDKEYQDFLLKISRFYLTRFKFVVVIEELIMNDLKNKEESIESILLE